MLRLIQKLITRRTTSEPSPPKPTRTARKSIPPPITNAFDFRNTTDLLDEKLLEMFQRAVDGWTVGKLTVRVRYSRGADFSGTCIYAGQRILINLGSHLAYPYKMYTNLARAKSHRTHWVREAYAINLRDAYEVVLFIFLHELYHMLIKKARRNPRQKEGMCDRFAARYLVDNRGAIICTNEGTIPPRDEWDFQDLEGFVTRVRSPQRCEPFG
ncbi:MAG: hypothetical protein AABZ47_13730 [Planctomycetota bacterium]